MSMHNKNNFYATCIKLTIILININLKIVFIGAYKWFLKLAIATYFVQYVKYNELYCSNKNINPFKMNKYS